MLHSVVQAFSASVGMSRLGWKRVPGFNTLDYLSKFKKKVLYDWSVFSTVFFLSKFQSLVVIVVKVVLADADTAADE